MATEKEIVLRDWEMLKDDEQIVRSAATKGKYINACFKLLSVRQEVSIAEARKFFYIHVILYVHRLLNNRQVFKADHVLKNIGFDAKNVFFEISKESTDSSLRDYLLDHCKSSYEGYESHLLFLEEEWMIFNRLKHKKESLIEEFQAQQLNEFDLTFFDAFCKLDLGLKNKMVAYLFFKDEDITLAPHLDKLKAWEYYIAKEKLQDIKRWTNNVTLVNPTAFEETVSLLYQQWKVDQTMFDMIEERLLYTDAILYGVAKFGCFSTRERDDLRQILHRIVTVQSLDDNSEFLTQDSTQHLLLKLLENREMVQALSVIESEFMKKVIETGESSIKPEIVCFSAIKKLLQENVTKNTVFTVSKCLSKFILERMGDETSDDQRIGLFLEHLFEDTSLEVMLTKEIIPQKFQHLQSFLGNAFLPEEPVEMEYLIKRFLNIDIKEIAHTNFDRENNYIPTFNLLQPVDQDIYPTKLSYLHYVKQGRGIYAAYYFFLEHLRQYSKVTTTHALLAAENVTEFALQNLNDPNLVTHCISFMENIGIDTQKVRALIRCLKFIGEGAPMPLNEVITEMFQKLMLHEEIDTHVVDVEALKLISDHKSQDFKMGICELLSKERSWYKLLLLSQYMNLSIEDLFQIVNKIHISNVRKNLMLAIQYDKVDQFQQRNNRHYRKRRNTYGRQKSEPNASDKSIITHFMHVNHPNSMDLMGAVLQLTRNYNPDPDIDSFKAFLKHITDDPVKEASLINYAWHRKWPIFAVLAAVKGIEVSPQYLGIVWLATSIGFESENLMRDGFQTFDQFSAEVVSFAVKNGFTETLAVATKIFYQSSAFAFFAEFLEASKKNFRKTETIDLLKKYLIVLNSEDLSPVLFNKRNDGLIFSAKLLLLHIENNFPAPCDQLWILNQICEIGHFDDYVNFPLMRDVLQVLDGTELKISLGTFDRKIDVQKTRETFLELCSKLRELKLYEKAIKISKIFNLQMNEIIFEYWHVMYEEDPKFNAEVCEKNMKEFGLKQEVLIKFCLSIAQNIPLGDANKYLWYKNVLDFIYKYNLQYSDWVHVEGLESQLVYAYFNTESFKDLPLFHSQHFRTYVSNENFILYNTLEELKIIGGLEELSNEHPHMPADPEQTNRLNYLMNILLDKGDVVQALRYQRIFNHKSTDLHFVTLCMSLAENKLAPHELAVEERKAMAMDDKIAANKFNRRTLLTTRLSQSSCSSSPNKPTYLDSTSDTSGYEFEEIPSREKQAVKEAIQNLAGKVKYGSNICRRVLQIYRASMYMDLPYEAVYKRKDPFSILKDAVEQETLNKLLVISDLISASKLTAEEVASFISNQLAESIIKSRFYLLHNGPTVVKNILWGFNLDTQFHLFLDLCPNTTLFGNYLLLYCEALNIYRQPTIYTERKNSRLNLVTTSLQCILQDKILSQKKQNTIQIEFLIKAHLCFLYECSMEGIAEVLQKAKALVNVLTNSKSWNLIIKLLTGIGKYKEMFYCFEILIENQQFEALLKKCDEEDKGGLQNAIMLYLREYCPNEKRYYQLAAVHFSMYKELADLLFREAEGMLLTINQTCVKYVACHPKNPEKEPTQLPYIKGTKETNTTLQSAMENYASSAEFYILDQKLSLAQVATGYAELIALQICLINQGYSRYGSICVLRANEDDKLANYLVNNYLSVPQSLVLSRAIGFNIDWARAIFEQYVQRKDEKYLVDFLDRVTFTETMLDDVYKIYSQDTKPTNEMKTAMLRLISFHPCSSEKYRNFLK